MWSFSNVKLGPLGDWLAKAPPGTLQWGAVAGAMLLVMIGPFVLRPSGSGRSAGADGTVVILSPHNDTIRTEFSRAFASHMKAKTGQTVRIDWRDLGGTSDISKFVNASYEAAFDHQWRRVLKLPWKGQGGPHQATTLKAPPTDSKEMAAAREEFLKSHVSIGVDIFFGGGSPVHNDHASKGHFIDAGIFGLKPDWFKEDVIPAVANGERLYHPDRLWIGACLSSFGICYNKDWLKRLDMTPPDGWDDLGDQRYAGAIALADPTKSGTAMTAFEMLIQQHLAAAMAEIDPERVVERPVMEKEALDKGWTEGLNLIQRIAANSRYFADSAAKIPFDVAQGNAAAGMSIDFYGRMLSEQLQKKDGSSRVGFVIPKGGTSVGADPISMFRGAPNRRLAQEFMLFVLSPEGQRIWHYKAGEPGGPKEHALRRMPIRKDAYTPSELAHSADPDALPYERAGDFVYHPEWTYKHNKVMMFVIQVMCLETHDELVEAWQALTEANFPPRAKDIFFDVGFVGYTNVTGVLSRQIEEGKPLTVQKRRRDLRENFRKNYELAAEMARKGL